MKLLQRSVLCGAIRRQLQFRYCAPVIIVDGGGGGGSGGHELGAKPIKRFTTGYKTFINSVRPEKPLILKYGHYAFIERRLRLIFDGINPGDGLMNR
jgi:hypothetical protein